MTEIIFPRQPVGPKPSARVEGGTPANWPKGLVPMNPWGRAMPKPERQSRPALTQVFVKDKREGSPTFGHTIPVGPKQSREFSEMFMLTISSEIAAGRERNWEHPHIVTLLPRSD